MNLNERISKVIEYSKLTSSEFADEIDVQRSSISHITSGRNKPSLEFIIKIKSRFPEIMWDWLINGEGEMLKSDEPEESTEEDSGEKIKPTPLPDLFTLIGDDNFGVTESEDSTQKYIPREADILAKDKAEEKITDSQRLEPISEQLINQAIDNQGNKIKRIVLFFENGKFESFEP
ncbi:helix-turn-helix transcriptional regulator [Chryseobacterium sp.]|uniref:helix-turn-helix domain-containing protein n=1 Tax=Chryseobacterium sp. TaxID=1871047 RepID=UPI0025C2AB69|nr:helix-turn-helix transcriptional regulator [Chryseobacterium sp.]